MLDRGYKGDPPLLAFYKKKLLIPGWVVEPTFAEAEYIASKLQARPRLRQAWRVSEVIKRHGKRKVTPETVTRLCRFLAEAVSGGLSK